MSSSEKEWTNTSTLSIPQEAILEFAQTGYSGADKLSTARNFSRFRDGRLVASGVETSSGENIQQIMADYTAWLTKREKTVKEHNEYVKLAQDRPGRKATILTPMSGPEAKTLLGAPTNPSKTILG